MKKLRGRVTSAHALSLVALFVALGGVSYAVALDSVKSKHIVDGHVKSADLKDEGVKSQDIKNDNVGSAELAPDSVGLTEIRTGGVFSGEIGNEQVKAVDIGTSEVGAAEIAQGAVTRDEILNATIGNDELAAIQVRQNTDPVGAGSRAIVTASCNAGELAISGGGAWDDTDPDLSIQADFRQSATVWNMRANNDDTAAHDFTTSVYCLVP